MQMRYGVTRLESKCIGSEVGRIIFFNSLPDPIKRVATWTHIIRSGSQCRLVPETSKYVCQQNGLLERLIQRKLNRLLGKLEDIW